MDFSAWSPSHLIVAGLAFATIIGQTIAVLARLKTTTERLEKHVEKQGESFVHALERFEDRVDKRFVEVNQRIDQVRTEIGDVRSELKTEMSEIRSELSKMNQNHIAHLSHHES
jgi:vacuolar-type H+-ATPase subunit I/STV1